MMIHAALALAMMPGQLQPGASPLLDWRPHAVITPDSAYLIGEERQILPPKVVQIDVSPDGRWALAYRSVPETDTPPRPAGPQYAFGGHKIEVYGIDLRTEKATVLMQIPAGSLHTTSAWLSTPGQAMMAISEGTPQGGQVQHRLYRISVADGTARAVAAVRVADAGSYPKLVAAPPEVGAAIMIGQEVEFDPQTGRVSREQMIFLTLNPDGEIERVDRFRRETTAPTELTWLAGRPELLMQMERANLQEGGLDPVWGLYSPANGLLEYADSPPDLGPVDEPELTLETRDHEIENRGAMARVQGVWITSQSPGEEGRSLIAPDAEAAALSPNYDVLVYSQSGAMFLRRLTKIPLPLYRQQQIDQIQQKAVWHAQDVWQAAARYWADNAERFPSPSDFRERLHWLVRDPDSLKYFTYVYPGGPIPNGGVSSRITLGYVNTTIGRATLGMDGRVHWEYKAPR